MKEEFAKFLKDVFGVEPIVVDGNSSKIAEAIIGGVAKARIEHMINDAEQIAEDIKSTDDENLTVNVRNAAVVLANTIMFDEKDARIIGVDGVKRLAMALQDCRVQFEKIALGQDERLINIINKLEGRNGADNDIDEDLTKLSKEELIARLRKMSK